MLLRDGWEQFVRSPEHAARTVEAYEEALTHWERAEVTTPASPSLRLRMPARNPDAETIDAQTLVDLKNSMLATHAPNTVRKVLIHLRAIFNRLGPRSSRNPLGVGLLGDVPYCPLPAKQKRRPRTAREDELDRLYRACEVATWPRCEVLPADWWQSLIVVLYNIALRRLDYLAVAWEHVDLKNAMLDLRAHKTDKDSVFPLHSIAVEHLRRIQGHRVLVWPWRPSQEAPDPIDRRKTSLYRQWHKICAAAGILKKLVPHDIRKTSGSQLFEVSPGAACELLQHSSIRTTQESYANVSRQTRELMLGRQQPAAFVEPDPPEDDDEPPIIRFPGRSA